MLVGLLAAAGSDAAVEGDVEGAQGGLPAVGPANPSLAGGVEAADGQVQHLQRRLLGGEMASGVDRAAEPGVERLDGVGTRYEVRRRSAWCSAGPAGGWWAYGVAVRNRGLRGTRMGKPFLLGGLRARVSSWPPLRLVRLRCARVSVGVVQSQRFPTVQAVRGARDGSLCRDGCAPRVRAAGGGRGRPAAGRGPHRGEAGSLA